MCLLLSSILSSFYLASRQESFGLHLDRNQRHSLLCILLRVYVAVTSEVGQADQMPLSRHSSQAISVSRAGRMLKNSDVLRFLVTLKLRESHICPEYFLMTEKRVLWFWGSVVSVLRGALSRNS